MAKKSKENHIVTIPTHLGKTISVYQYLNYLASSSGGRRRHHREKSVYKGERRLQSSERLTNGEVVELR